MSNGNFKVRCIEDYKPGEWFTKGKTYESINGIMTFDDGWSDTVNSFEWLFDHNPGWVKYLTLVGESKKPLGEIITIRRKKKSVVATITDGENAYSQYTKLSDANGDWKTAVKMVIERLMDKWKVEDGSTPLTADGFKVGDRIIKVGGVHDGEFGKITDVSKLITVMLDSGFEWKCHDYEIKPFEEKETLFDWDGFKQGKFAVHCDTEEKAREFLKECDTQGIKWDSSRKASEDTHWINRKNEILYFGEDNRLLYSVNPELHKNETIIDYTPSKPAVKEVPRKAEVGEWVKVLRTDCFTDGDVKVGDIFQTVKPLCSSIQKDGAYYNEDISDNCKYVSFRDYVVLENYRPEEPKPLPPKEEPKVENTPEPFVKAKVGDKIKVVKVLNYHIPVVANDDEFVVKETSDDHVATDSNSFYDADAEYIILDSTSDKPLSQCTKEEIIKELFNRVQN